MLKQAELARLWGVSREYVRKLASKGMPLTSEKEATAWREANARRRKSAGGVSPAAAASAKEESDEGVVAPVKRGRGRPRKADGDMTLEGALRSAVLAQIQAKKMLDDAMAGGRPAMVAPALSIHTKAIEARFSAEKAFREEQMQRRVLVPLAEATELFRKGWDMILGRLKRLPQAKCTICNPADPRRAFDALQAAVTEIITEAQAMYE